MRPKEQAERSAARLAELGFATAIASVTQIRATGAAIPRGTRAAIVATSARALDLLSLASLDAIADAPLFVVGSRGGEAAARRGLVVADEPAIDVGSLTRVLLTRLPAASRVIYLAGEDRRGDLERALGEAGHHVAAIEIYVAEARGGWSADEAGAVARCGVALHYSRRGAELARRLAEAAGIGERFRGLSHLCLSRDVAEPLRSWGAPRLGWASAPREEALFDALSALA